MNTPGEILSAAVTRLSDKIDKFPSIREATVDSVSPLSVRFDTDTLGSTTYGTLVSGLTVGTRVLTIKIRHYIWVLGAKGGALEWAVHRPTVAMKRKKITDSDGTHDYTVYRTNAGTPVPGLVRKAIANDFDKTWVPGTPFAPPRENIEVLAERIAAPVVSNASGWDASGVLQGPQIKDRVAFGSFNPTVRASAECIGFLADGRANVYSSRRGDTVQQMLDDGVVDSFGFGPILVEGGTAVDISGSFWGSGWNDSVSARTILGQTQDGDIVLINVPGETGVSGIRGASIVQLAVTEGCYNAVALDGGGSVQSVMGGVRSVFSSDASGGRALPDFVILDAICANEVTSTVTIEPNTGPLTGPITLRRRGDLIEVSMFLSGTLPEFSTTPIHTGVPREFLPAVTNTSVRGILYLGGTKIGILNVQASGVLSISIPAGLGAVTNPSGNAVYSMRRANV